MHLTTGTLTELVHALFVGGIIAVRYLWPLWFVIIALWFLTRFLRAVARFFGFAAETPKPTRPVAKTRR